MKEKERSVDYDERKGKIVRKETDERDFKRKKKVQKKKLKCRGGKLAKKGSLVLFLCAEGIEGEGWWGSVSASLLEQSWFFGGVIEEEQGEISSPPGS
ncbi:hypothetical protein VitviT2T_006996 [Vitis vinifera]|uniref:Uncharacterized protein n=1 Tax=Vitis vinifera TaxID=29760 RepID=A0ABY9BXF3_VITVI|nr:hypothetical protein VitviT2T_006996 [Vitis vinifera]